MYARYYPQLMEIKFVKTLEMFHKKGVFFPKAAMSRVNGFLNNDLCLF